MTIHWCGTPQQAQAGLRALLAAAPGPVRVWPEDPANARLALGSVLPDCAPYDADSLGGEVQAGDVIVAMLAPEHQLSLATLAANKGAHFVSPGSLTPQIEALHGRAVLTRASLMTEVGAAPGVDHLMARHLVAMYRGDPAFDAQAAISLVSLSGVVPAQPRAFAAGLGTEAHRLWRAMSLPARALRGFREWRENLPWDAAEDVQLRLAAPETFEMLPRGDALPLLDLYGIDPLWQVERLERGLLRPPGWSAAWGPVLAQIDTLNPGAGTPAPLEAGLTASAGDRLVISVTLAAMRDGRPVWHRTATLDAEDTPTGTALARVSGRHVVCAALAAADPENPPAPGTHTGPRDAQTVKTWLDVVAGEAQHFAIAA